MSEPLFDRMIYTLKRLPLECRPTDFRIEVLDPGYKTFREGEALRVVILADLADLFEIECRVESRPLDSRIVHTAANYPWGFGDRLKRPFRLSSSSVSRPEICVELLRSDLFKVLAHLSERYQELYSRYVWFWVQFHHLDRATDEEFLLYRRIGTGEELSIFRKRLEMGLNHFSIQIETTEFSDLSPWLRPIRRGC